MSELPYEVLDDRTQARDAAAVDQVGSALMEQIQGAVVLLPGEDDQGDGQPAGLRELAHEGVTILCQRLVVMWDTYGSAIARVARCLTASSRVMKKGLTRLTRVFPQPMRSRPAVSCSQMGCALPRQATEGAFQ